MGAKTYPEWLLGVWSRTLAAAGSPASPEETNRLGSKLLDRWDNPSRVFHGVGHLIGVLEKVDELAQEASCPCVVRLAAFYHGAVLSTDLVELTHHTWGEDEGQSAELALAQLTHLGLTPAKAQRVHHLVACLGARPKEIKDPDLAVLCDAERSILASDPRTYRAYAVAVREECAASPLVTILEARLAVLRRWLSKDRLFLTSATAAWEGPARHNVEAELARCLAELQALTASGSVSGPVSGPVSGSVSGPVSGPTRAASPAAAREPARGSARGPVLAAGSRPHL
ncbi:MAG: hypothetical protein LBE08_02440 [Bifidobacteriaceae bacterium]|jgi:predicted metal-dependent HD superfamily phosphohydrolase|nr:hypothetical protein [Bifidobacteriaceae bacterium]